MSIIDIASTYGWSMVDALHFYDCKKEPTPEMLADLAKEFGADVTSLREILNQ